MFDINLDDLAGGELNPVPGSGEEGYRKSSGPEHAL